MRLLRIILGGKFLRKNQELRERTSRWIWALLARLPDKGELDYQEIGWIRELGKRAVLLMVSLAEMEVLKEAAATAIFDDVNQYAVTWGAKGLRDALASRYARWLSPHPSGM